MKGNLGNVVRTMCLYKRGTPLTIAGIPSIEHLARKEQRQIIQRQLYRAEAFNNPLYDDAMKIELLTRICVRPNFRRAIGDKVEPGLLKKMEAVFFDFTYPAPPVR